MVWYVNVKKKVMIWCKTCKKFFWNRPKNLLDSRGCIDCGLKNKAVKQIEDARESFPAKAEAVHPNKNYYHLVDYKGVHDKVELHCIGCDVPYWIAPNNVLNGSGHSGCAKSGFDDTKPAILYYLRVETRNQIAWKIGITNRSIQERFNLTDLELITEIRVIHYEGGYGARDRETEILREFKEFKYMGDLILSSGNSELFTKDILGLDRLDQPQKENL